jgi:hypothetical protein
VEFPRNSTVFRTASSKYPIRVERALELEVMVPQKKSLIKKILQGKHMGKN